MSRIGQLLAPQVKPKENKMGVGAHIAQNQFKPDWFANAIKSEGTTKTTTA